MSRVDIASLHKYCYVPTTYKRGSCLLLTRYLAAIRDRSTKFKCSIIRFSKFERGYTMRFITFYWFIANNFFSLKISVVELHKQAQ